MSGLGMDARGLSEYNGEPVFNWLKNDQLVSWNASREIPYGGQNIFWIATNIQTLSMPVDELVQRAHNRGYCWIGDSIAVWTLETAEVQPCEGCVIESCFKVERIAGISNYEEYIAHLKLLEQIGSI